VRVESRDYRLSNLCNLACLMCNPRSSSRWIADWNKVAQSRWVMGPVEMAELKGRDWHRSGAVLENFRRGLGPHLRHLHFAGGEPLLMPEMAEFLRACVDSGLSGGIELSYNTNLTRIPEVVKELWPRFGGVRLLCSVDAVGGLNDLIRYPSRWETIDRNLRDLDLNHRSYGVTEAFVSCTVQVANVFSLEPLFEYLAGNFSFVSRLPHLVDLHFPEYFSTQILPPDLKRRALEGLKAIYRKAEARIQSGEIPQEQAKFLEPLFGSMNFLLAGEMQGWIGPLLQVMDSMDALRGQDSAGLIPVLGDLRSRARKGSVA
jgi:MoaA/NifB/PqqE/SkfB family radical SAM enzyme